MALKPQSTNQSHFDGYWKVWRLSVEEEIFIRGHRYHFPLVSEYRILSLYVCLEIDAVGWASILKCGWRAPGCLKLITAVNTLLLYDVSFTKFAIPGRHRGSSWLFVPAAKSHQFMKQEPGVVSIHPWQPSTIWGLNSPQPLTLSILQSIQHLLLLLCLGLLAIRQVKW